MHLIKLAKVIYNNIYSWKFKEIKIQICIPSNEAFHILIEHEKYIHIMR